MTEPPLTVIVIPQPTANGALHVGHLSGPYLAADVAARAARARGERVLALAGVDVHQNYVLTRAENDGVPAESMIRRYRGEIAEAFTRARIAYDAFLDPQAPDYHRVISAVVAELVRREALPMREVTLYACADCGRTLHHSYVAGRCDVCGAGASGGSCEGCGGFTSAQTLLDPVCDRCGGPPRPFTATVPVLAMERHREALRRLWLRAELPTRVRVLIGHYLDAGLPEVPVAYPTNWGVHGSGPCEGLRLDVYAEVGLSYLYGVARALAPEADGLDALRLAWDQVGQLWHFHGIDNAFYYAIMFPALYEAVGLERAPLAGLVVNEFYTLDGAKFSTSRNHAIWAQDLLAEEDPEVVRLYLAWDRPDRYGSDFTRSSFEAFRDHVRPLLDGAPKTPVDLPAPLVAAERARGERALRLVGFDAALAARSLLSVLATGESDPGPLRAALVGSPADRAEG